MKVANPFITSGYESPHYFCDRIEETKQLSNAVINGNHTSLISPRRLGKTGLIHHLFQQDEIKSHYYTFLVDLYATKNLQDFIYQFGKNVLKVLKSRGRKTWELFLNTIGSLRGNISFDINGNPEWGVGIGDIKSPLVTLDEIFDYLEKADRPCVVAFDEFQVVAKYPEKEVEALLRTHILHSRHTQFIFSGSQRHIMSEMFLSASRPFYQSTRLMTIEPIECGCYVAFAQKLFDEYHKKIEEDAVKAVYEHYHGVTWYVQSVLNALFAMTPVNGTCTSDMMEEAIRQIIGQQAFAYAALLYQLSTKQKEVLMAICREGEAKNITSKGFLQRYRLTASSVQAIERVLLDKDFITHDLGVYRVYDEFFAQWLQEQ